MKKGLTVEKALPAQLNEFIDEAHYLELVSNILKTAKAKGAVEAEVGLNRSVGLTLSVRKSEVETVEFNRDQSLGITIYKNNRKGSASSTDLSETAIQSALEAAIKLAEYTEPDPFSGLAESELMPKITPSLDLYHPWVFTMEEAIEAAKACEASALAFDKRITNSDGATLSSHQGYHVYGNSHGFVGGYPSSQHSLNCIVIAKDVHGMERDYQYTVERNPHKMVDGLTIGKEAAERTVAKLSAQKIPTQQVPVIFHAQIASGLLSHFLGGISGGRLFRQSSFLIDSLGKQIFPEHMHLFERPHVLGGMGSAPFDGDGVMTEDKDFVANGVVKNYVLDAYSARKLKMKNTGNSGGVHNLMVSTSGDDLTALLKRLDKGLLITSVMGQGINLVTGDYSRGATGFWVENGQIQFPVHEVTVAGNLRDMFKNIIAVGNDVDTRGNIQTGSLLIGNMMISGT